MPLEGRKFKAGDVAYIREWDDMAQEYGIDEKSWFINTHPVFSRSMRHLCGRRVQVKMVRGSTVKLIFEDTSGDIYWSYSTQMLIHEDDWYGLHVTNVDFNVGEFLALNSAIVG